MKELTVYEHGKEIGTLTVEQKGLYYYFLCKISQTTEQVRRVSVISKWRVEYLGIPYPDGSEALLETKIPVKHFPDGITGAVATQQPRGMWLPWCGEADGVPVLEGYICRNANGIDLALPPEEAQKFPAWLPQMDKQQVQGSEMAVFHLNAEGELPPIETETGGIIDETDDAALFGTSDDIELPDYSLPDGSFSDADGGYSGDIGGGTDAGFHRREADCADL